MVMADYKEVSFKDITVELSDGLHAAPKFYPNGDYIFVNAKNIVNGRILDVDPDKKTSYSEYLKYKIDLDENTVLYSIDGTIGNVAKYRGEKVVLGKGACYLKLKPEVDTNYIFFYLQSPQFKAYIRKMSTGSTIRHISLKTMRNHKFNLPDLLIQKKIANILSRIQNKIDTNQQINENLLQQLHLIYLQILGFSDKEIVLGNVVNTTSGGTPSRKHDEYYSDGSICWVKSKELLSGYIHDTEEHINELAVQKSSAKVLPAHSVLIAMYGATVGAYGIISRPMTCNQAVCALLSNENYPYTYLYQLACESQQSLINLAVGSAQQNISQVLIKQLPIHNDYEAIQKFHSIALPIHEKIESLQAENANLSAIRDSLLPRLMSGELDVSELNL